MSGESNRLKTEKKIVNLCRRGPKSLGELAEELDMNKNTLRAGYLYPMTKAGKLMRSTKLPFKSRAKYQSP